MIKHFKYYLLFFTFWYFEIISADLQSLNDKSINYLPLKSDFKNYVRVLQNIKDFYLKNTNEMTISVAFGIFIGNVHLGRGLKDSKTGYIPFQTDILDVYVKNEEILKYYNWHIAKHENEKECLKILPLFANISEWIDRVEELKPPEGKYMISHEFGRIYQDWNLYAHVANARQAYNWIPSPVESDSCLKSLAASTRTVDDQTCVIDGHCYDILKNGSDIGYALCHRALLLVMARNSLGCSIFSPREDDQLLKNFCSMGFAEAEYIAYHNYGLVDLLLEYMSVCALAGRTEFLRRVWLANILEYQTSYGCFSEVQPKGPWKQFSYSNNDILDGQCNSHTTALASTVLAAAIRYVLEENY